MKETEFKRDFEKRVYDTINDHRLFTKKDKLLVACSGGKDSTSVLHILHKRGYNVEAITIDAGIGEYSNKNMISLRKFCDENDILLHTESFRDFFGDSLRRLMGGLSSAGLRLNPCTVCGTLRRNLINRLAKRLGADYVVTGHNLDDEAQSIMMNLLRNNLEVAARLGPATFMSKSGSGEGFVGRVKPLYFCSEAETERYSRMMGFPVKYSPCPLRKNAFRNKVRKMLDRLEKENKGLKANLVNSFSRLLPELRGARSGDMQGYCRTCGEPSGSMECRACSLLSYINIRKHPDHNKIRNKKTKK